MDKPGGFATAPLAPAAAAAPDGSRAPLPEDLSCPCCYRPGRLCESFAPAEAAAKVHGLRVLLASHGLDAYVIPSGDAHSSEYVAACDERRAWVTGFTGSAGTALVTKAGAALLWTDGRYFNQAEQQLAGGPWTLMRQHEPGVLDLPEWCREHLGPAARVGANAALASLAFATHFAESGSDVVPVAQNFVDVLWGARRPAVPRNAVYAQPLERSGEAVASKLARVAEALGDGALCLNALDQICWLTNLRGSDVECNPVFFAYAVAAAAPPRLTLFLRCLDAPGEAGTAASAERVAAADALRKELAAHFRREGCACGGGAGPAVELKPYDAFDADAVAAACGDGGVTLEKATATLAMADGVPAARRRLVDCSPVEHFKAKKNAVEVAGLRAAGRRDCAVLCGFFAWLEDRLRGGDAVTEAAAADEIARRRGVFAGALYKGDSFDTISSTGANASVIHYKATHEECVVVDKDQVYLCDTGAQYVDGTTDITRTNHFGAPSSDERRCYTRVLQGHVGLARAVFPEGTPGVMLDALARQPLWRDGLNYLHGTGHGMGSLLNVHEGPFGIGGGAVAADKGFASATAKLRYLGELKEGHYVSDEPGFYLDGQYGFRIESDLVAVRATTTYDFGNRNWLAFDYLTPLPFSRSLCDETLLAADERAWIDAFHADACWAEVAPLLTAEAMDDAADAARARAWLWRACRPLGEEACPPVPPLFM